MISQYGEMCAMQAEHFGGGRGVLGGEGEGGEGGGRGRQGEGLTHTTFLK